MIENLAQLVVKVYALFMRFGIKSLTMDDIARELKVSKKTLYEFVDDKQDLVLKVMQTYIQNEELNTCQITESHLNAIDELLAISVHVSKNLTQMHPSIHYDLEKYYPEAWEQFTKFKTSYIYNCICKNIENGIKEGLYREDLNASIIAKIYIHRIDVVFSSEIFPFDLYQPDMVYQEMIKYHILGISSEKGRSYLYEKLNNVI